MDDSCAVCAETLEWVAYGPCGHKDVCSTCVARLRFICDDRRCCICKTESDLVFVTKALGDYTRMINDFSLFPTELREGRVGGSYWYHEHTQALFDDLDQYKMIKEMCRLSCSVCDKMEEQSNESSRRRPRFRNIEQLKGHLFHQHRALMCSLCLEGRKVFICEQKLYTRAQLNQHIQTGDSEVDGTESERGGFTGHPICEFCKTPFYGDNELYSHMSTEHYTCHICQRQHPGQFEYYKNYDDLEIHFRQQHFLCEDEACLGKKFIVFTSEAELKRHNALEHGGSMSRSKRNAALQIPTSFRYRGGNEQSNRRGRSRTFHRDYSEDQIPTTYEDSYDTANARGATSSSRDELPSDNDFGPLIQPMESLAVADSARYLLAAAQLTSRNAPLEESSFPPLPVAPATNQQISKRESDGARNSMAFHLRNQNNVKAGPSASRSPLVSSSSGFPELPSKLSSSGFPELSSGSGQIKTMPSKLGFPELSCGSGQIKTIPSKLSSSGFPELSSGSGQIKTVPSKLSSSGFPELSSGSGQIKTVPSKLSSSGFPELSSGSGQMKTVPPKLSSSGFPELSSGSGQIKAISNSGVSAALPASYVSVGSSSSIKLVGNSSRIHHSMSAPNLTSRASIDTSSASDFPPVSAAAQVRKVPTIAQEVPKVEDVHTANKSLVERIRSALEFDEDKYTVFKEISGEYRQGVIDAETYLAYVDQFGLLHLVLELARLCPDPERQRALIATYNAEMRSNGIVENGNSKKGKSKCLDYVTGNSKDKLADSIINEVRKLQSSYKPSEESDEVLSKDGYRTSKVKLKVEANSPSQPPANSVVGGSNQNLGDSGGKGKKQKKTSKFHRVRLGDGLVAALLDLKNPDPDLNEEEDKDNTDGVPVRGAWRNGGGQKLVAMTTSKGSKK